MSEGILPADQAARQAILEDLERSMLVEAAAGTGKTTCMVGRMLALLRAGRCTTRNLVAVTFTRKAAAELRGRFQLALEGALAGAVAAERSRLAEALLNLDQCFIGTIHSFCGRLLRERPVEAGVDLAFEELDERADRRLRREAWARHAATVRAEEGEGVGAALAAVGLELAELEEAFLVFADYPDVEEWPLPEPPAGSLPVASALAALEAYLEHMRALQPRLPRDCGRDTLIPRYRRLPAAIAHLAPLEDPRRLMTALGLFGGARQVQREWMKEGRFDREETKAEQARWDCFVAEVAEPQLTAWRERRYAPALRALQGARAVYDGLRGERGKLSFGDLLRRAAALLRERAHVRGYFAARYTHLLVDEFQDTDPIQAEVMLLLTATDRRETDWRRCRPRPGALFVVGDPKQSIYRFRRADIVTYNRVKAIVAREGRVLQLSTGFRSTRPVIDWVNEVFARRFPGEASEAAPAYVALDPGRPADGGGAPAGVCVLSLPASVGRQAEHQRQAEAALIARIIHGALEGQLTVARTERELAAGRSPAVTPEDFLIVTLRRGHLAAYARALQALGIPHQVSGGGALNEVPELRLLHLALRAALRPEDPVALVAALRSELFGVSDVALYRFKRAGGVFSFRADLPEGLADEERAAFSDALLALRVWARWLDELPPLVAIERVVAAAGLLALAAAGEGGAASAGSLAKALELLRGALPELGTASQLTRHLGALLEGEEPHDGLTAVADAGPAVRLMNLHRVKGLEAPVVFLAGVTGERRHEVEVHVDRAGERARGYLALFGRATGHWHRPLLAHPRGWAALAGRERDFLAAEAIRLRYVAATRAGSLLVISRPPGARTSWEWDVFAEHLSGLPELPDPGAPSAAPLLEASPPAGAPEASPSREAVTLELAAIQERVERVRQRTYQVRQAKTLGLELGDRAATLFTRPPSSSTPPGAPALLAVAPGGLAAVPEAAAFGDGGSTGESPHLPVETPLLEGEHPELEGEQSLAWGSVAHLLLHAALGNPWVDLLALARAALAEHGLDPVLGGEMAAMIRAVLQSELWERAQRASPRLGEVPFELLLDPGPAQPLPTLVRGVIDLAFREPEGWVLVDYKTDQLAGRSPAAVARRYTPQLDLYAAAWSRCTGQPVKERGVFLSRAGRYVVL